MLTSAFWGLIQGLSEFLPISSSGHLVLVPAVLGQEGPDLATSAVLHLGTLLAVLVYFRTDLRRMLRFDAEGRRLVGLVAIGTVPAAVLGLTLESFFDEINQRPKMVAIALFLTGLVLMATRFLERGRRPMEEGRPVDAVAVGLGQALALIPGVSRSGATIATGLARGFDRVEAARYSFLLGIPAIAGGGLLSFADLASSDAGIPPETWVGMAVAAVSGYAAIAVLLRLLGRVGLAPFGAYCVLAGGGAFFLV